MLKKWFNNCIKIFLKFRYRRIENIRSNPHAIQKQVLLALIKRAKNTEFGKEHSFEKITDRDSFAAQVPICDYEAIKKDIYRMMDGESDILWPGKIKWFAKSSGTTSDRSKYLPVTDDFYYKNNVASAWDTSSMVYHEDPDCMIYQKKSLIMGGSLELWKHNPEITIGDVSAILLHRMPQVGRPFYSPDFETSVLKDWDEKIDKMTDICSKDDIVMFGGVPTWTIVLLNKILTKTGAKNMHEVWPNARYYFHGGVGFDPYKEQFKAFFPDENFKYYEVYNATEGYFAIQDRYDEKGMLLLLDSDIYYEFISMEELVNPDPKAISLADVEVDKHYAIVISTSAGLWRYMPGDTVQFTSLHPYRIMVSGRTKHFINVFGEEVMVGNTDKALSETMRSLPAKVKDYTVAPIFMKRDGGGGHEWVIEFDELPDNLDAFEILLDSNLQKINSDYAAKRYKDIALNRLRLTVVPSGTFHRWLERKGKVGGQNKVPRLFNSRKYVEELLLD